MAPLTPLSKANTSFSLDFLNKLSGDNKTGNIFFSPFSISSALAMVMLGARGNTLTQISQCLNLQDCQDDVHSSFGKILKELNKPGASFSLSVANRLYGEKSCHFIQDFLEQTRKLYNAELEPVDFKTKHEEARVKINSWVEEQTEGKINDVLAEGSVNETTRLLLVNAIYFKGSWETQFNNLSTRNDTFRLNKKDKMTTKMMNHTTNFPFAYIPEARCKILEMPYKGGELSMLIFLPQDIEDDTTGLEKLEEMLTYEKFAKWTRKMSRTKVNVRLPRFKMEETYELKDVLMSMGMEDAFHEGNCDLSGMSEARDLVVSGVTHKAFVDVNEEGTEAAAAATFSHGFMGCRAVFTPIETFNADHPFLFFIRHKNTMNLLFAGRFCSPM